MYDWTDIAGGIAALVVIGGALFVALKRGRRAFGRLWARLTGGASGVPRDTMRVVPWPDRCWWALGRRGETSVMQVVGHWYVTNITKGEVRVVGARLVRPPTDGRVATRDAEGTLFGEYAIPPGRTTEASADFWIEPPVCQETEDFKATVVLIDQFGNERKLKDVLFRGRRGKKETEAGGTTQDEEAGILDLMVEVEASGREVANSMEGLNRSAQWLGRRIARGAGQMEGARGAAVGSVAARMQQVAQGMAAAMTDSAESLTADCDRYRGAWRRFVASTERLLSVASLARAEDRQAAEGLKGTIEATQGALAAAAEAARGPRASISQMRGVSRDLNRAVRKCEQVMATIVAEFSAGSRAVGALLDVVNRRLEREAPGGGSDTDA